LTQLSQWPSALADTGCIQICRCMQWWVPLWKRIPLATRVMLMIVWR
jgi:hypothetical protein